MVFRLRPQSYTGKNAGWEFVTTIGKYFDQLTRQLVQKSPFFGVMVDETTDISTTTQLIIYIKYIEKLEAEDEYTTRIQYLDLVQPSSGSSSNIKVLFFCSISMLYEKY